MENLPGLLSNTNSVVAIMIGIVSIFSIVAYLISKGKLNVKTDKFSIESAKQNTKSLLAECRTSSSLMAYEFAQNRIEKFPAAEYQIRYTCELVLNRVENMIHYNNITTDDDYIKMRFTDIKAIVDSNRVSGGVYDEQFYKDLYEAFCRMIKQIVLIKKHYKDED